MRKVHFWYRHPLATYFSIENIFHKLEEELASQFHISTERQVVPNISGSFKGLLANNKYASRSEQGIHHITGDIYYITSHLKGAKIVTYHDFVLMNRTGNPVKKQVFKYLWYTQPVKAADIITVISPQVKKELLDITGVDEKKVRVIPNFYNPFFDTIRKIPGVTKQNAAEVLFIGTTAHKNLRNAILALEGTGITLNIVGRPSEENKELITKCGITANIFQGLSLPELGKLYQGASCLLFPSLYEGFGLPIIEAQAAGLPVITSNREPMSWVAGKAARLINPLDVADIRSAVINVLEDTVQTALMVEEGFKNVQRFQLSTITAAYAACYEQWL